MPRRNQGNLLAPSPLIDLHLPPRRSCSFSGPKYSPISFLLLQLIDLWHLAFEEPLCQKKGRIQQL